MRNEIKPHTSRCVVFEARCMKMIFDVSPMRPEDTPVYHYTVVNVVDIIIPEQYVNYNKSTIIMIDKIHPRLAVTPLNNRT